MWIAAVEQHLATTIDLSSETAREASNTWAALWNMLAATHGHDMPSLEVFVTRCGSHITESYMCTDYDPMLVKEAYKLM